jgi:hypothetical protein
MLLVLAVGGTALAQPTEADACRYFSAGVIDAEQSQLASLVTRGDVHFGETSSEEVALERYLTLVWPGVRAELRDLESGEITGVISAQISCSVDIIDRRVLIVGVTRGQDVGRRTSLSNGASVFALRPLDVEVQVGAQSHSGRY